MQLFSFLTGTYRCVALRMTSTAIAQVLAHLKSIEEARVAEEGGDSDEDDLDGDH